MEETTLNPPILELAVNIPIAAKTALTKAIGQGVGKPEALIVISAITGATSKERGINHLDFNLIM